jgi:peroxiredoxin family protein
MSGASPLGRVAIFLHAGDYDRVHQGLSIAASAVAAGRRVDVFFFWWALERLLADRLDAPDFPDDELNDRFEARKMPTLRALLGHLKESGLCSTYACTASMAMGTKSPDEAASRVDHLVGWSTILNVTAGVTDRFYL